MAVKKGTAPSWAPASNLGDIKGINKKTHKARWCVNEEVNIDKKLQEGWTFVNEITNPSAHQKAEGKDDVRDINGLSGALQYREMVAMKLPLTDKDCEEGREGQSVESRKAYLEELNQEKLRSTILMDKAKNDKGLESNPQFTPSLTID